MSITRVQIYGQRCSGTNALSRLVEANFPQLEYTEAYGFKHWLVPDDRAIGQDVLVVVIAREIGAWLQSLHRNPWHCHPSMKELDFGAFIRAEWHTVWDTEFGGIHPGHPLLGTPIREEMCPRTGARFANAPAMRAAKLASWTGAARRAGAHLLVSLEWLRRDPRGLLDAIGDRCAMVPTGDMTPLATYKGERQRPFQHRPYPPLSAADRSFAERHSDPALESLFALEPA